MANQSECSVSGIPEHPGAALAHIFDSLPLGLVTFNRDREVVFCNRRFEQIAGIEAGQIKPGTAIADLLLPFDPSFDQGVFESDALAAARSVGRSADGRMFACTMSALPDGGGLVVCEDLTEREALSAQLTLQHERAREQEQKFEVRNLQFDTAINNMSQGLCFFDGERRLIVCNHRYVEMYGLTRARVEPGTTLNEIVDMRFEAGSFPAMSRDDYMLWRNDIAISNVATDSIVELRDGRTFQIRHRPMPDAGWVATHEDITEQRQSEARIARMARHDALTDLANRVLLNERLEQALTRIDRDEMVAIHHLDLDQFKGVNDTLGHHAGDRLLQMVADRLRALVHENDTIARMGGDEFIVVQVAMASPADAAALARRMILSLSEPYEIDGHLAVIGTSVGIAVAPKDGANFDELLRHADFALYSAKGEGRGTSRFFEPVMNMQMQIRRAMEQDMRKALPAGEFVLHYQPVVHLASNSISKFEALIRWNHPEKGMILPAMFIPLAEENGFIVPIGEWVIRDACMTAARWPEEIHVAVNISAVQFRSPGLMPAIIDALAVSGLHPARLEIEITETALLRDREATFVILHQLRSMGVRIAIDDFGTGYSSLTYLQSFPFDRIKIDRSFVKNLPDDAGSRSIVGAIAALAKGMGMAATAEGVETSQQRDHIASEGCTEMQGFLFSKPLPAGEIERLFLSGAEKVTRSDRTVAA